MHCGNWIKHSKSTAGLLSQAFFTCRLLTVSSIRLNHFHWNKALLYPHAWKLCKAGCNRNYVDGRILSDAFPPVCFLSGGLSCKVWSVIYRSRLSRLAEEIHKVIENRLVVLTGIKLRQKKTNNPIRCYLFVNPSSMKRTCVGFFGPSY